MFDPLLRPFSVSLFAWWLIVLLSPTQTGAPPAENVLRPPDDSIARQSQGQEETVLYFPDYVDGGGWSVQLVLSNVDPDISAQVPFEVYDPEGQPVLDLFDSELTLEIPALGTRILRSTGSGAIRRGWIRIEADSATISGLLTYRHAQSGIEVGVKPVELGAQFALFVEETMTVGAGVAVFKPDSAPHLELRVRDEAGNDPLEGGFVPWEDFHQAARTLPEWFSVEGVDPEFLRDFRGLLFLETEDESEFAPLGMRFGKRTSSLSAVPAIRTQGAEPRETNLIFPDYVDGEGWSVQLVLSNVDPDAAAEVRIDVYDPDGQPVPDLFDSDLTFEIPSLGSRVLRSAGSGAIRRGWIQVQTDSITVAGLLTYRDIQSGIEVGVEPVRSGKEFALFVEESETVGSGLALFNPDADSRIELRLRDEAGNDPLGGVSVPHENFHQRAGTLPEWFDVPGIDTDSLTDFRGLLFLRTEDDSGFVPLGLRFGKRNSSLSAVPAIRIPDGGGHLPPPAVTLSVSPSSIDRGRSTTLTWSSTGAESAEITPDIGEVPTSGTRKVSPNVTTTYRITVTGADGQTATASVTVTVTVATSARAVLGVLYESWGGAGWTYSNNWLTDAPLRDWYGVEVDGQGRVIGLHLFAEFVSERGRSRYGIGLTGEIPPELASLPHLRVLDLSGNDLTGPIPAELAQLSQLRTLDLSANDLTGPIPPALGQLSQLRDLDLRQNQLTGPIPPALARLSQLRSLDLTGNQLTSPIPPGFLQLGKLYAFRYTGNVGLCAPGTTGFVAWLKGIERHEGPYCNESDVAALDALYRNTGGEDWTNSGGWLGDNAVSEWYGIRADSLGRVTGLDLRGNGLTGLLPRILSQLAQLTELRIDDNALSGRLPLELARLPLQALHYAETGLCAPVEESFQVWLNAISSHEGTGVRCAPLTERDILVSLFEATDGSNWAQNDNWLTDALVSEWSGIHVDRHGLVIRLDLRGNGLTGPIPAELGQLSQLQSLDLRWNRLTGSIPSELGRLAQLESLDLRENRLRGPIPADLSQLSQLRSLNLGENWLTGPIPAALSQLSQLQSLDLSWNRLTGLIPTELGQLSELELMSLSENQLTGPIPAELGQLSRLRFLFLGENQLTGPIPAELGQLSRLRSLSLNGNQLSGPIPAELGELAQVASLSFSGNHLSGSIPAALGRLSELESMNLSGNHLTGSIPARLGNLSRLEFLSLNGNALSGQLPGRLGNLSTLRELILSNNELTGPVPTEFGEMSSLQTLVLTNNPGMEGTLSSRLTELRRLEELLAGGTDLCAPSNRSFQTWLQGMHKRRISPCVEGELPMAYLTQAVQSRKFPVPLVAGKKALLRVFPTARQAARQSLPPVRARFYVDDRETHVLDISGKSTQVPAEVNEGLLSVSANGEVPGDIVQPGLEMVIEIEPNRSSGSGTGLPKRIPETGRQAVVVRAMPTFDLTLIPFLWRSAPDRSIVGLVEAMATDPEGHELLWHSRILLPIGDLEVTAHEPVLSFSNNLYSLLRETEAIHAMEGARGYYMGMMSGPSTGPAGLAHQPGEQSVSIPTGTTIAHELGHNLSLYHAPCGGAGGGPDPSFPETNGSIGAWGYDFREGGRLVPPFRPDLMSYCSPGWISDFHFTNALRYRLHTAAVEGVSSLVAAPANALLLWGGVDAGRVPFLEPAFVVQAPASLPPSTGEYRIIGRTADGDELFSLSFEMPEIADGDGSSSFAFVLPVQPDWAHQLASIALSGPGGSAALDQDTDRPVTILRNPRTGQIRAILRGAEAAPPNLDATVSALSLAPGLERLTSRGIPDPDDWTQ